ncbi:MAG: MG2 domain-containing protein, partial [Pseudomonadota bacterium]
DLALDRAIERYGFRILRHEVESDAAEPRICVVFSEPLVGGTFDYAPFVAMPAGRYAVEAADNQLCVSGVQHGVRYPLTLREGLPAESGEVLLRSAALEVYVRDRSPDVRFAGRAHILPRSAEAAIPVVTVNTDRIAVSIYRVGERNLLPALQDGRFGRALSGYGTEEIADRLGAPVWEGEGEVTRQLNTDVTTALPVGEAVGRFAPGAYVMTARIPDRPAERWEDLATQWFIVTDLGLLTLAGTDGLHVFVRGLSDAAARPGTELRLIARNNEVLGRAETDAAGRAVFAPGLLNGRGGNAPALLTAEGGGDFAFLDLTAPAFDLSDRGVEGRPAPGPVDVFLTTERGVYRPGATVHTTILTRDAAGRAISDLPLTAIVTRPDGVEHARSVLTGDRAGGHAYALPLPPDARRGRWRLDLYADPEAPALATTRILVEDFVPERLDLTLAAPEGALAPGGTLPVTLTARYLWGAPAAGLAVEGETRVGTTRTLPDHPGFVFGLEEEEAESRVDYLSGDAATDAEGAAEIALTLPPLPGTTRPQEMTAALRVREGSGRPVERSLSRAVLPDHPMIGLRPLFDGQVEEGGTAAFELIALGEGGERAELAGARWTLSRVRTRYQWYEVDGRWSWDPVTTRTQVGGGTLDLSAGARVRIEAPVDWGRYELRVTGPEGRAFAYTATSLRFTAGWWAPVGVSETPDVLDLALDRDRYVPGDTAELRLTAQAAGEVLIAVVDGGLVEARTLSVAEGETTVPLEVTEAWGAGAYVTATLLRPMDVAAGRNPARALGLAWASVDPGTRALAPRLDVAGEAAPRGPLPVALDVPGLAPGETVHATIAAVDVGILNLTGFEAPDPGAWYFGQRALGVEIRDVYGHLIDGLQGFAGRLRSGGDGAGGGMRGTPPTDVILAEFSGLLTADAEGRIETRFDLPDFNGTVRVMAVVWSDVGVGQATADVLVRDPVVTTVSTPRFLTPGDESRILLEIAHATGPTGEVAVEVETGPALILPPEARTARLTLGTGERAVLRLPVIAMAEGVAEVTIRVTTPDGRVLETRRGLAIRATDAEVAETRRLTLAPGEEAIFDADFFDGLRPAT